MAMINTLLSFHQAINLDLSVKTFQRKSMKNIIDHGSLNVHPGFFSLDEFIESDAPGTLSWLYMDADDLNNDLNCYVQDQQIKTFDKTKVGNISIHETR